MFYILIEFVSIYNEVSHTHMTASQESQADKDRGATCDLEGGESSSNGQQVITACGSKQLSCRDSLLRSLCTWGYL